MANEEEKEKVELGKLYSEVLRENLGIQRVNTDELKIQVDLSKEIGGAFRITNEQGKAILKNSRDLSKQTANILRDEEAIIKGRRSKRDIDKEITKSTQTQNSVLKEITQATSQIDSISMRIAEDAKAATDENLEQSLILENIKFGLQSNLDINRENLVALDKELIIRERIEKKLGVLGKLVKGVGKIPIVGEFLKADKILEEMEETAAKVGSTRFNVMTAGIMEAGAQLKENMLDPFVILTSMFAAGFTVDQSITELERSLGVSRDQATGIRKNFETLATSTKNTSINSLDIEKSFKNLQEQFGTASTILRDDIVAEMAELGKLTNMSAESQANFARFANISGKNAAVITEETRQAVVSAEQEKGLRLDINKVLDQTGKITGQIAAQLGGNVTAIASAVAVAKQFGMELEDVAASGAALLNFEQSISNELEAELLIGKQINLERARLAALTGDYETLTREINANVGDFGDFTEMNVLQQQALAQSVGMTADQLSDVLLKNANIAQLAQEARDAGKNDLADQLEKRSTQEKFNDAVMKLKTIFVDIANGPVMILVETLGSALSVVGKITDFLGLGKNDVMDTIAQVVLLGGVLLGTLNPLKQIKKVYTGISAVVGMIKNRTLAINAAEKLGLIRQGQANILRNKEVALQTIGNGKSQARNFYENQSLGVMIKRNAQKTIDNIKNSLGLGIDKQRDISSKSTLFSKIKQGAIDLKNNAINLAGSAIDKIRGFFTKSTLLTKIKTGATELANNAITAAGNALSFVKKTLEESILLTKIRQGIQETFIIVKKGIQNTLTGIRFALESSIVGSLIAQGFGIVKNIAKQGALLAITVAKAAAELVGVSAATLGIGTIVALAAAAAGIAYLNSISKVEDGIADSNRGPFKIQDRFGATSITAMGDSLAVSPNINKIDSLNELDKGTSTSEINPTPQQEIVTLNTPPLPSAESNNTIMIDALNNKLDALNNNIQTQTKTIQNRPVSQNTMINPSSIINPRIPFEKSSNYTAMT